MKNIALIGMPGSGKTDVGREAARLLGMGFLDIDYEIVKDEGREIHEIFENEGETYFRRLESERIKKAANATNCIIATGGGAVLDPENMKNLGGGLIVFLDREPEEILSGELAGRPLLAADRRERLYELYDKRLALYKRYADFEVKAEKGVAGTAEKLIKCVMEVVK